MSCFTAENNVTQGTCRLNVVRTALRYDPRHPHSIRTPVVLQPVNFMNGPSRLRCQGNRKATEPSLRPSYAQTLRQKRIKFLRNETLSRLQANLHKVHLSREHRALRTSAHYIETKRIEKYYPVRIPAGSFRVHLPRFVPLCAGSEENVTIH
jgi:hypothetical protein